MFDLLREQLYNTFRMIPMFIQARVSLDRVNDFLRDVSEALSVLLLDILSPLVDRVAGRVRGCGERFRARDADRRLTFRPGRDRVRERQLYLVE